MTVQTAAMTIFILAHGITAPSNGVCWIQKQIWPMPRGGDGFFLLSEVLLGTGEYGGVEFDYTTPYFNDWKGSRGQDWCNDFYSRSLSITEQKAVLATSKSDALYGMYYDASDNILDGDKVFFLSAEEAENAAYGFTDDNARIANYGDSAYVWWLRSPRRMNPDSAGTVNEKGAVIGEWVGQTNAARPCLQPEAGLCPPRFCSRWRQRYC